MELAYKYFQETSQIDLNDEMGNASGGIHIAALGGTWMAAVMGFAGLYIYNQGLLFDPHLPDKWNKLEFSVYWHSKKINIQVFKQKIMFKLITDKNIQTNSESVSEKIFISAGFDNWKELNPNIVYSAYKKDNKWIWDNKDAQ